MKISHYFNRREDSKRYNVGLWKRHPENIYKHSIYQGELEKVFMVHKKLHCVLRKFLSSGNS